MKYISYMLKVKAETRTIVTILRVVAQFLRFAASSPSSQSTVTVCLVILPFFVSLDADILIALARLRE